LVIPTNISLVDPAVASEFKL